MPRDCNRWKQRSVGMNSKAKIAFYSVASRGCLGPGYKWQVLVLEAARDTGVLHAHEQGRAQPTSGAGLGEIKGGLKSTGSGKQGLSQQRGSARNFGAATRRAPRENSSKKI